LPARADIADVDEAPFAIDRKNDAQSSDARGSPFTGPRKRFCVWAEWIVSDLVEASDHPPLHVAWDALEIPFRGAAESDIKPHRPSRRLRSSSET
jgi:hypothetical protein